MKPIKLQVYKEIKYSTAEGATCDFCQEEKSGWAGEIEVTVPEVKLQYIPKTQPKFDENKQMGWGHFIPDGGMHHKRVVVGESKKTVRPLICKDCVKQLAQTVKK